VELAEFLDQRSVAVDLEAQDKPSALAALVELAARCGSFTASEGIIAALMEREDLVSTGIGHCIAVPHCKTPELDKLMVAVARCKEPVEFGSLDGQPVKIFFLLIAPQSAANTHLKALAKIARFAKNPDTRKSFMEAEGAEGLFQCVLEHDKLIS